MRCKACNVELTDDEATAQDEHGFIDLCFSCITAADRATQEFELGTDSRIRCRNNFRPPDDMDG